MQNYKTKMKFMEKIKQIVPFIFPSFFCSRSFFSSWHNLNQGVGLDPPPPHTHTHTHDSPKLLKPCRCLLLPVQSWEVIARPRETFLYIVLDFNVLRSLGCGPAKLGVGMLGYSHHPWSDPQPRTSGSASFKRIGPCVRVNFSGPRCLSVLHADYYSV